MVVRASSRSHLRFVFRVFLMTAVIAGLGVFAAADEPIAGASGPTTCQPYGNFSMGPRTPHLAVWTLWATRVQARSSDILVRVSLASAIPREQPKVIPRRGQ